jgi:hypothetical protein
MLSPCIPSEAATDSGAVIGFGIISSMIWIVAGPLAMLFGGLLAYLTFRWFKLSERRSHTKSAALVSGGFPGLVFIIIIIVLYQKMLCA